VWIWYEHSAFFRRFGLNDGVTIVLDAVLLFVVLFYVYPSGGRHEETPL